ncbi:MAG: HAMP domain-containing protein [Desulfarculaceae bacterium]|nr:HAMP domain-containing protein [Desulfarculaceae bacterium]
MIHVVCESCGKEYKLDPNIVRSGNASFACKSCGHSNALAPYLSKDDPDVQRTANEPAEEPADSSEPETRKVPFSRRLQVKMNAVLIPLIILIMGGFTAVNYYTIKQDMNEKIENASEIVSQRLSNYLVEAFWALDDEILSESLKSEMMDKRIYAINLIDRNGKKVYMGFKRDDQWGIVKNDAPVTGSYAKEREPIVKGEDEIGYVEVFFTSKFLKEQLQRSMINIVITAVALLLAVFACVFFVVKQMVVSPIANLTDLADRISVGNLDIEIPKESKDEIGALAEAFERMRVSMVFAIKQLRKK